MKTKLKPQLDRGEGSDDDFGPSEHHHLAVKIVSFLALLVLRMSTLSSSPAILLVYRRLQTQPLHAQSFSSKGPPLIPGPGQGLKSWESGARLVKNTQVENQYLEHIRQVHDPSMHLKTIEDELKGTIGRALGKQGEKVNMYLRAMEHERRAYHRLVEDERRDYGDASVAEAVDKFNSYRKDAIQARWELIVHRQAVGFTVDNHHFIMTKFPIDDPLPTAEEAFRLREDGNQGQGERAEQEISKNFGDQLDWWQRIGRWR